VYSSKDTLSLMHTVAHSIPNPFHYHGSSNHIYAHHHHLLEHFETKRKKYADLKSPEKEKQNEKKSKTKQDQKYKFYDISANHLRILTLTKISIRYYDFPTKITSFIFPPPSPPPQAVL
jgi:hypothetical protein